MTMMSEDRDFKTEIIREFFGNFMPVASGTDALSDPDVTLMSSDEIVFSLCKTVTVTVDDVAAVAKDMNFGLQLCPDNVMRWKMYRM